MKLLASIAALSLAAFIMPGCEEGPAEDAGERIDDAAEDVQDAAEDVGDKAEDAIDG